MKVHIGPHPKSSKTKRKVSVRIDAYDTWDMDSTLAYVILPMLKQLKKTQHGSPNTDDADVPEHLRSTSAPARKDPNDVDKLHFKRWTWVLNEMIFAFDNINKDWEDKFRKGKSQVLIQAHAKIDGKPVGFPYQLGDKNRPRGDDIGHFTLVSGPKHTYTVDYKGIEVVRERMRNGFRLFGKYYQALWD